ncbi:diphthamide synthesis protein [Candidatus Pacearchaeota archaeon]|nr:diphthamide synthesis protein [Candidatus Pacearchaeota archaeon]
MKFIVIDGKYKKEVKLSSEAIAKLKKYKKIAVYTTTQFNHKLPQVLEQLKKAKIQVTSSQPERTNAKFQILGCDMYHGNLKLEEDVDGYLYVGDGKFHPNALLFQEADAGTNKEVVMFDPTINKTQILTRKDIQRVLDKEKANVKRFLNAERIGVIVTTKPGQEHFHYTKKLESKYPKKQFYNFVCDTVSFSEMENFPYIQAWINTACPRIGAEDILNTEKAVVNAETAMRL